MFLFGKKRMVAEIEGGAAGASGPGAAPSGVSGPAAPAGGSPTPFPHILGNGAAKPAPGAPSGGGAGEEDELDAAIRADAEGRGIPHDRVRGMRGNWEKRARTEERQALLRELGPLFSELQELRGLRKDMDPAAIKTGIAKSLLQALGVEEEKPPPKYLTQEEFDAKIQEFQQNSSREAQHRADLQQASVELQDRKTKHAEWFQHFPWLEEVAAAVWSTRQAIEARLGIGSIIDGMVKQMEAGIGKRNEAYAARKAAEANEAPITPGSGIPPGKKPEKVDNSPDAVAKRSRDARMKLMGVGG